MDIEQKADKINRILLSKYSNIIEMKNIETSSPLVLVYMILDKIKDFKYLGITGHQFVKTKDYNQLLNRLVECRNLDDIWQAMGGYTKDNFKLIDEL